MKSHKYIPIKLLVRTISYLLMFSGKLVVKISKKGASSKKVVAKAYFYKLCTMKQSEVTA